LRALKRCINSDIVKPISIRFEADRSYKIRSSSWYTALRGILTPRSNSHDDRTPVPTPSILCLPRIQPSTLSIPYSTISISSILRYLCQESGLNSQSGLSPPLAACSLLLSIKGLLKSKTSSFDPCSERYCLTENRCEWNMFSVVATCFPFCRYSAQTGLLARIDAPEGYRSMYLNLRRLDPPQEHFSPLSRLGK
jgi:hypothetical protein